VKKSIEMVPPTGPAGLKLYMFYNWQSLHGLVVTPATHSFLQIQGRLETPWSLLRIVIGTLSHRGDIASTLRAFHQKERAGQ